MREIKIKNLKLYGYFGVLDFERKNGQNFIVNVTMQCDVSDDWSTDKLETTVDYAAVATLCADYFEKNICMLLETATYSICEQILLNFDKVKEVTVEIQKPDAPINLEFEYVSVATTLKWENVALSLGSNMNDRQGYIEAAILKLKGARGCKNIKASSIYETAPYGDVAQADFLNCCVVMETYLSPKKLHALTSTIENEAGRERLIHWGPRTLDIDIILFGRRIIDTEALRIPHGDMVNREFVLEPLAEIAPYMMSPVNNKSVVEMLRDLRSSTNGGIR